MKIKHKISNKITKRAREEFLRDIEQKLVLGREALDIFQTGIYGPEAGESLLLFASALKGTAQTAGLSHVSELATEMTVALLLMRDYGIEYKPGFHKFLAERFERIEQEIPRLQPPKISSGLENKIEINDKKILLVEQNQEFSDQIRERLEQEGYLVSIGNDLDSVEKQFDLFQPDLMIIGADPGIEKGLEVCRRIRSDFKRQVSPLILLTEEADLQEQLTGYAASVDDHLAKPFELDRLIDLIKDILLRVENNPDWEWMDGIDGVYNRRYLDRRLNEELTQIGKSSASFSLAMIDIDTLKQVNEAYGFPTGDQVLLFLVSKMLLTFRTQDIICRYSGEEFVVLLPDTPCPEAQLPMERLRQVIAQEKLESNAAQSPVSFTISAGLAFFPEDGLTGEDLLAAADTALYWAKETGGNRVLLSKEYTSEMIMP
ncbi:MAG: GGDEF domain-containing response regulator [Bacillota bacterium]